MVNTNTADYLVDIARVSKQFVTDAGVTHALRDVSIAISAGESLGLVGESGSGKSTLGRLLVRLDDVSAGHIRIGGTDITTLGASASREFRKEVQLVFQDPFGSLNPRMTVRAILARPLEVHEIADRRTLPQEVDRLLHMVGLPPEVAGRYSHQLSGGQQQRVGIARALAVAPKLAILDEPTSALDVSVQAQILTLLQRLKREQGLTFLFISHDLNVVRFICERIAVMYRGRLLEVGRTATVVAQPRHPYTRLLLAAVPSFYGLRVQAHEAPPAVGSEQGCPFFSRCVRRLDLCRTSFPATSALTENHSVACHNPYGEQE